MQYSTSTSTKMFASSKLTRVNLLPAAFIWKLKRPGSQQVNMEIFHGLALSDWEHMESYANQVGFYREHAPKRGAQPGSLLAFASSLNSDVECSEGFGEYDSYFQQPANPAVSSPSNSMKELWLDQFMPLEQYTSGGDGLPPTSTYEPVATAPTTHFSGADAHYSSADALYSSADNYASANMGYLHADTDYSVLMTPESQHSLRHPGSPQSQGTLDGSDISDLLDDIQSDPNGMYTFNPGCVEEPPSAVQSQFGTLEELLSCPAKSHYIPEYNPAAPPLPLREQLETVTAKDIVGMDDIEKLLQAPLPTQGPIPKCRGKRRASKDSHAKPDKKQRKKEQNKTAALRYRQRKREEQEILDKRQEELQIDNRKLRGQVDNLEREIKYLRSLMEEVNKRRAAAAFITT